MGHVTNTDCMMNPSASIKDFWCPSEVLWFQRKYGLPNSNFSIPGEREIVSRLDKARKDFASRRDYRNKALFNFRRYGKLYKEKKLDSHKKKRDQWLKDLRISQDQLETALQNYSIAKTEMEEIRKLWKNIPGTRFNPIRYSAIALQREYEVKLPEIQEFVCYGDLDA